MVGNNNFKAKVSKYVISNLVENFEKVKIMKKIKVEGSWTQKCFSSTTYFA